MESYDHRLAIGRRFGARIAAGDAVFMTEMAGIAALPCTVTHGEARQLCGINLFMLLQVMKDRAWSDSRFFTVDQVKEAGWSVMPNAKKIGLQYLVSTGSDGLPLEVPQSKQFQVFNASDIDGVPAMEMASQSGMDDIEKAATKAGFPVGSNGLRSAVHDWLLSLQGANSDMAMSQKLAMMLRTGLAVSLLEVQTGLPYEANRYEAFAAAWVQGIEADPLSFFQAVQDAEKLASVVMSQVRAMVIKRQGEEMLQPGEAAALPHALLDGAKSKDKTGGNMVRKVGATARVEAMFAERVAVLAVPYKDKDRANVLGAVWYGPQSLWFVPQGVNVAAFKEWNPRAHSLGPVATDEVLIGLFTNAMSNMGLDTSGKIEQDGKWHNVAVDSKAGKNKAGSYILSLNGGRNGEAIGTILNKHTGESFTWKYEGVLLTPEQRARMRAEALAREWAAEREIAKTQDRAAIHANEIWAAGSAADEHGYVLKKGIVAEGLRQVPGSVLLRYAEFKGDSGVSIIRERDNYLIVPMMNEAGQLRAVQAISPDGAVKSFMRGAQKKGTMLVLGADSFDAIGKMDVSAVAYGEGMATGASFRAATGLLVVVCFDAGNLETVVAQTSEKLSAGITRVLAVDNDQFHVERAVGFLSNKLGLNPHAVGGEKVWVANGVADFRPVSMGDVAIDGQWHQVPKGSYCVTLNREDGSEAIRSVMVEIVPEGARKVHTTFVNRGVESGRIAMLSMGAVDGLPGGQNVSGLPPVRAVMVVPQFKSLAGRPTDWNDLVKNEGVEAIRKLMCKVDGLTGWAVPEKANGKGVKEPVACLSR